MMRREEEKNLQSNAILYFIMINSNVFLFQFEMIAKIDLYLPVVFVLLKLSLINLGAIWAGAADIPAFRSMRTLRALRPLRAVSRWEGMRVSTQESHSIPPAKCLASANCLQNIY